MKTIAMLFVVLFAVGAENEVRCAALQADASKSPELEEAAKLISELPSLLNWYKYDEAVALAKKAVDLRERILGPNHELVASATDSLADVYVAMKKYDTAEPLYRRSLSILEKKGGPDSQYLTTTIESLALVRFVLRDNSGAEKLYLRALSIKEKSFGPDNPATGKTLDTVGVFYERIDKPAKATEFFKRRLAISEKELGPNNPDLLDPLYKCMCAYFGANNASEAKRYQARADQLGSPRTPIQGGVMRGYAILRVEPEYPSQARLHRVGGRVVVEIKVDECGRVIEAKALNGHADLMDASVKAARQWRFNPTKVEGRPIKSHRDSELQLSDLI